MNTSNTWHTYSRDNRTAIVKRNTKGFYVQLVEGDEIVETREVYQNSEKYAEDVAQNWVDAIISSPNPWVSDKEFQEWLLENRGSATEPVSDTKILRLRPANTPFPELNKIFQTFRPERLNFTILAKGTGYPPHRDVHRTCNINFKTT